MIYAIIFLILAITAVIMEIFKENYHESRFYNAGKLIYVVLPFLALGIALKNEPFRLLPFSLFLIFCFITGIGTGAGYHRLLTHFSFETKDWVRFGLIGSGALASPTPPIMFACTHLKHHAYADETGDPHSPMEGLLHSHIGWIFKGGNTPEEIQKFCKKLLDDKLVMWINKWHLAIFATGLFFPFFVGLLVGSISDDLSHGISLGWQCLLWGGFIRYGYHNHAAFSVNSICHTYGERPFETKDDSRNNWLIGILAFGEGWHNNHHAFPRMAKHGMGWRQFDLNGMVIGLLERVGLAWDVSSPNPGLVERRKAKRQPLDAPAD